ncbi:efflux RND transporter permease subunit [Paenibacillus mucilaginosus]|uniref:Acriflavin resistance protein n=1 Tax=Paenibacillus mucilaginosus (strain KNP414) TaxID=1036673 RepID=F8FBQ1_PAEMK|nr:efflux RND transporter permease subunit [Paenibacillus mucilaginosus]AEI43102.1 acriflavin resistance protein [Paenibacillus mucilaginosus KNP414]MCG7212324.1 efflux RND transporter permease subunit [Paenibacillus mucilaginosus]WDM24719.1 efflux RND transporter permease subunit [Paenibacillus mucilaginosus]
MIGKALRYRKITMMFMLIATVVGAANFMGLQQRENPEITATVASVRTLYPGASPDKVEQLVTKKIEDKISEMDNILKLTSTSQESVSSIVVELVPGSDAEQSWDTLRQKVQAAEAELPDDAEAPVMNTNLTEISEQILHLVVGSTDQFEALRPLTENWKEQLQTVSGVSSVEVIGLPERQIRVELNAAKLENYRLHWGILSQALQNSRERVPIGTVDQANQRQYVQLTGEWSSPSEVAETVIYRSPAAGSSLKLKDVAEVTLAPKKLEQRIFYNGKPAIDLVIKAQKGVDIPDLQDRIDTKMEALKPQLPSDVELVSAFNQKQNVQHLFSDLGKELLIGIAAVIVVCSLGLTLGTSLLVSAAIPLSILIGLIPMKLFGVDLNQISIVALVIVLGILVDDAIVVNDNIERRLELGDAPAKASLLGSKEVGVSILTATVATASAFFPLYFLKGNIGDFIRPIPLVITSTLLVSMVMSLTVVPIVRQWEQERRRKQVSAADGQKRRSPGLLGRQFHRLSIIYENQLRRVMRKPLLTGLIALAVGTSSFALLPLLGVQYFPTAEREELLVDIELPAGSTFADTSDTAAAIGAWIGKQAGVKEVSVYAGRSAPKFYYTEMERYDSKTGQILAMIDQEQVRTKDLVSSWRKELSALYPDVQITPRELENGPPVGAPIAIRLSGTDLTVLQKLSAEVQGLIKDTPGAVDVSDDVGRATPTVQMVLDKDKANYFGLTEKDLSATVRLATEGIKVSDLQYGNELIDITLFSDQGLADPGANRDLHNLLIPSQNGGLYPLKDFVQLESSDMISKILRYNQMRTVTVRSYTDGVLPADLMKVLLPKLDALPLPDGYTISVGGENEERDQSFAAIGQLSIVVLMLIFIIIAIQFYSLTTPILILSTVYLALGGALIGLFLTGAPIGFMALMGVVSLSGMVVRNGIVLIEFVEQAREEQGLDLNEAIIAAGKARLRPILLTAATAVSGLMPMAIAGGSLWRPMAVSIISGLIYSTILTLVVVPSLYRILAGWKLRRAEQRHTQEVKGPHSLSM